MKRSAEFKLVRLRECGALSVAATPEDCVRYWKSHIVQADYFNGDVETLVVLLLNSRNQITGHALVAIGLLNTLLVHTRETFRTAILAAAHAVVLMHNHPSGNPQPSQDDVRVTQRMYRAGLLLGIHLVDHVIMGSRERHVSLRSIGCLMGRGKR